MQLVCCNFSSLFVVGSMKRKLSIKQAKAESDDSMKKANTRSDFVSQKVSSFWILNCFALYLSLSHLVQCLPVDPNFMHSHPTLFSEEMEVSSSLISPSCSSRSIQKASVQKQAPPFTADAVVNGEFKTISLSDYRGKYLVIFFYPMDFTFVCPTEIIAFSDRVDEFRKNNCELLAISVDSKYSHLAWINTPRKNGGLGTEMSIPLVSDITKKISSDYGVLLEEGEDAGVSLRGLYILNENGIIRHISVNDLPVGRNVDEVLRLVQAFQHTDLYGEVCPSGWKPGDPTMFADPERSKSYFQKQFS